MLVELAALHLGGLLELDDGVRVLVGVPGHVPRVVVGADAEDDGLDRDRGVGSKRRLGREDAAGDGAYAEGDQPDTGDRLAARGIFQHRFRILYGVE